MSGTPLMIAFWVLALAASAAVFVLVQRADRRRAVPRPWITAGLRAFAVLLVSILLISPVFRFDRTVTDKPSVIILQDDSHSVGDALRNDTASFRQTLGTLAERLGNRADVSVFHFGAGLRSDSGYRYAEEATDISGALQKALEQTGGSPSAIILATDGRYNTGLNPVYAQLPLQSPLHLLAIGDSTPPKDLRITRVYAPRIVSKGSQFEVRADVVADDCAGYDGSATLSERGVRVSPTSPLSIPDNRYDRAVSFSVLAEAAGVHTYTVAVPPAPGEVNRANNTKQVLVEVVEQKKRVLLAAAAPHPDIAAIREALSTLEGYEVTVRMGRDAAAPAGFNAVIMHGLPAAGGTITASRIPAWYIVSSSTDPSSFNAVQQTAQLAGPAQAQRDAYPVAVPSFSLFTPPAGLAAVADRLPPLAIPPSIDAAPDAVALFNQRDGGAPLWAFSMRPPASVITAGEGLWRWRLAEYRATKAHRAVDECIRQTVSFLTANAADKTFRVESAKAEWNGGEAISFTAFLLNAAGNAVNTPEVSLRVTDSAGGVRRFVMERTGNSYRLAIGSLPAGAYRYSAGGSAGGKAFSDGGTFVVLAQSLEAAQTGADYPLLYALAKRYGGTVRPWQQSRSLEAALLAGDALKPRLSQRTESRPLIDWKPFFFLLLAVLAAEWVLRRWWSA